MKNALEWPCVMVVKHFTIYFPKYNKTRGDLKTGVGWAKSPFKFDWQ
jgi:hypothetical protein